MDFEFVRHEPLYDRILLVPPLSSQLKKAFLLILINLPLRTTGNPGVCTSS